MKQINQKVLLNLEAERFERRLRQKEKKLLKNRKFSQKKITPTETRHRTRVNKGAWIELDAPLEIDLELNRNETCEFINELRDLVRFGSKVRIGFEECRSIKLSGLVLLLAQIHKLRIQYGQEHITGTYPKNPRIERLLSDSGFYKLLHVKSRKNSSQSSKLTRYLPFKSDQKPNSSEIPKLREELLGEDLSMPGEIKRKIFRALSEAMTNVNHHAYQTKSNTVSKIQGRWWMVATLSARSRLFTLVFYDTGVGIPKTLTRKYPIEMIRGVLSLLPMIQPDDGQMIRAAMELGRTRTGESNRGKGLLDLTKLIEVADAGSMSIYSRGGVYQYAPKQETHSNHNGFVEGTLIEWKLPIDKALENLQPELENETEIQD
jgi:hypothetical protein